MRWKKRIEDGGRKREQMMKEKKKIDEWEKEDR